jgi:hypothetical protein
MNSRAVLFLFIFLFLNYEKGFLNAKEVQNSELDNISPGSTFEDAQKLQSKPKSSTDAYSEESEPEEAPTNPFPLSVESKTNNLVDGGVSAQEINGTEPENAIGTTSTKEENLDPEIPIHDPSMTTATKNSSKDPEITKSAIIEFLEKKETEEDKTTVAKVEGQAREIIEPLSILNSDSDDEEEEEDIDRDIEHLRSILSSLQQVLLYVAAGTFSFILLYAAFYINVLSKIYSRTICIKKN